MYFQFDGQFWCQRCDKVIPVARYYYEINEIQWLCKCNYVSKVSLALHPGPTSRAIILV